MAGATLPELPALAPVLGGTRMIVPDPPDFTVDCAWAVNETAHVDAFVIGLMSGTPHNDYVKRKWGPVGSLQAEKRRHKAAFLISERGRSLRWQGQLEPRKEALANRGSLPADIAARRTVQGISIDSFWQTSEASLRKTLAGSASAGEFEEEFVAVW